MANNSTCTNDGILAGLDGSNVNPSHEGSIVVTFSGLDAAGLDALGGNPNQRSLTFEPAVVR